MEVTDHDGASAVFPPEKLPRYPLQRRLGGTQRWSLRYDENLLLLPVIKLRFLADSARSLVTIPTQVHNE
jgi:hypothetical protein